MSEFETFKTQRWQWKGVITRHLRDPNREVVEEDIQKVTVKLDKLRNAYTQFEEVHTSYHNLLTEDNDIDNSDQWFNDVDTNYNDGIRKARNWLKSVGYLAPVKYEPDNADTSIDPPAADVQAPDAIDVMDVLTMPKSKLDTFSGNPLHFQSFMRVFDEQVDAKDVNDGHKLTRLLQYTTGPAKEAIRNCVLLTDMSNGYKKARDILKVRFGSDHLISQKIVSDLKFGKAATKPSELQQLADDLTTARSVLEDINMTGELGGQQCIVDIMQHCPPFVRDKWSDKAIELRRDHGRYPAFKDFVEFVAKKADEWGDPVYGRHKGTKYLAQKSINTFTGDNLM